MGVYTGEGDLVTDGPRLPAKLWISSALELVLETAKRPLPDQIDCKALIDTGAESTFIRKGLADQLGLNPVGVIKARTANSYEMCPIYSVQLILPNGSTADLKQAIEMPLHDSVDILIGRDILKDTVLIYQGPRNQFTLAV